jgi:hypothetical protein
VPNAQILLLFINVSKSNSVMFRRNKAKGSRAKSDDDIIAPLKGPDILSSSSSAELSKGVGGRKFSMRKKQDLMEKGKNGYLTVAGGVKNASSTNGNDIITDPVGNPRTQITIKQSNVQEPELPPRTILKRPPPLKNNSVVTNMTTNASVRPTPQPSAQQWALPQPSTKILETRDENSNFRRHVSSRNNPAHLPPLVDASDWGNSNDARKPPPVSERVVLVGPSAPSAFAPAAAAKPPPPLIVNGGEHVSGTAPLTRSGWSMQSNESSATNSDNYIQSLDNVPSLRPEKVS